jgi:hypothetical protein
MSHVTRTLSNVDWPLLARQKAALVDLLLAGKPLDVDLFTGLLNFLDSIQDAAAADGLPVVFLQEESAT